MMNGAVLEPVPVLRPPARAASASPHCPHMRAIWDLVIGIAGLGYLGVVLFVNLDSPAFGLVWIVLAGYEILEPRCGKRGA